MEGKKRILLIEDDPDTRQLYDEVLKEAGYDVVACEDGQQGLAQAEQGGFSLILLDVMMPKMDGIAFLTALKGKTPPKPNGTIMLLTNLTHDAAIKQAMSLGASGYLIKSDLDPGQLVEKIKTLA